MNNSFPIPSTVVHVVDDDDGFRRAIARLLHAAGYAVKEHTSAGAFLLSPPDTRDGCILLDLSMPGPSGLDLQQALASRPVPLPVVFVSGVADIPSSVRAMKAGAVDFLTKPVEGPTLLAAVRSALQSGAASRSTHARREVLLARVQKLTPREKEVFALVIAGRLNKQIADELGMAERTVKFHRAQVMEKMEAGSLAELVHAADEIGWQPEEEGAAVMPS